MHVAGEARRPEFARLTQMNTILSLLLLFRYNTKSLNVGYFNLHYDKAPPAARDSSEGVRAFNRRCYTHTRYGGLS